MNIKQFFQRVGNYIKTTWEQGKIQRTSRITYDVIWNMILFFIIVGAIVVVFAGGVGAGYFASLVKDEPIRSYDDMKQDIYNYEETSKLYFAGNKYIGDVNADIHREEVNLDDVADVLVNAVIATEDQLFYDHNGVVPKAIIRAVYQEATNSQTKTGGSTLTQQLIKNQILTNEVSFERKAKEILLAMRLENFFGKDEIMEAYLNIIPYGREASGRNVAGIQTAAKGIFGVDAEELTLPQAAYLAGLPQNPFRYTPFKNNGELKDEEGLKPGLQRMKTVLKRMYQSEFISEKEYKKASSYDIVGDFAEKGISPMEKYPAVVAELENEAIEILMKKLAKEDDISMKELNKDDELKQKYEELADRNLRMKGYKIHSTIDKKLFDTMKKVGDNYEYYGPDKTMEDGEVEKIQAGSVLIENKTGKILSFYPGRDFGIGSNMFNFAMQGHRQPGSTIKPLAVYGPAMDLGRVQPGSVIADIPYPGKRPKNYGGAYYGLVSAREALAYSYNVTADEIYRGIIDENPAKKYLKKMGFPISKEEEVNPSMALGGMKTGVTVEENTNAFATFSNHGKYIPSYMIEKITDSDGNVIYEHKSKPVEVFSPQASYLTLDMMRDVIGRGTAASLSGRINNGGVDWAGKTGTTNDYKDAWFVGTNPNVTLGSWIGYQTPSSIYCPGCSLSYSQRNQFLWAEFANALSEVNPELVAPQTRHEQPDGIVSRSYCATSGMAPSDLCSEAGLVRSDIYDSRYTPNKTDNSLTGGSEPLVKVDGKMVVADEKTPSEFVTKEKGGITFNKEFLDEKGYSSILSDLSMLIPRKNPEAWKKISIKGSSSSVTGEIDPDKNKKPSAPGSISASKSKVSWDGAKGQLIVGYRIYYTKEKGTPAKVIGHTTGTSYALPSQEGVYFIKAVNYFGQESDGSKMITVKKEKDEDKEKEKEKEEKDKTNKNDKQKEQEKEQNKKEEQQEQNKDNDEEDSD